MQFQFILSRGPEDPTRAVRCFLFAKLACEEGHDVSIFLVDDAVFLSDMDLVKNIKAPTGDELQTYMKVVLDHKTPILVCKPCAEARRIKPEDLPEHFRIAKGIEAIKLAEQARTLTF